MKSITDLGVQHIALYSGLLVNELYIITKTELDELGSIHAIKMNELEMIAMCNSRTSGTEERARPYKM